MTGQSGDGTPYRPGYELAAERILELIVTRELRPGDRLPTEQILAEGLGLSRSMTREAIKILTALGRVSARKGRGLFVAEPASTAPRSVFADHTFLPGDPEQIEQLLRFRQIQEVAASEAAAQLAAPIELRQLREALADCRRALDESDLGLWSDADDRFHLGIARASRNSFLLAVIKQARALQGQVVVLGLRGGTGGDLVSALDGHEAILAAISNGDPERAGACTRDHLDATIRGYRDEIAALLTAGSR